MTLQNLSPSLDGTSATAPTTLDWERRSSDELKQILACGLRAGDAFVAASREVRRREDARAEQQRNEELEAQGRKSRQRLTVLAIGAALSVAALLVVVL